MTTTILVSAAEKHEAFTLMLVTLAAPLTNGTNGLSPAQMSTLLDQLHPELESVNLLDYATLTLLFMVDGVPQFEQTWVPNRMDIRDTPVFPLESSQRVRLHRTENFRLKSLEM